MRIFLRLRAFAVALGLLLLCSCATAPRSSFTIVQSPLIPAADLPHSVTMNKDAGRGNELFVTVRLDNGEKLPFIIDTGSASTLFDKSAEPQLGKRLGAGTIRIFGVKHDSDRYRSPALYLGDTPLMMTGPYIAASDCGQMATNLARPVMGILGMDVLGHYCIQLDFRANKIRFLDDQHAKKDGWGKPIPLIDFGDGCYYIGENLAGMKGPGSLIDTGCNYDGWLVPELFEQWTNQAPLMTKGEVFPQYGLLDGQTYPQVYLQKLDEKLLLSGDMHLTLNGIGLRFLSRNLVTFDFPQRTMYLKRTSVYFLVHKDMQAAARSEGKSALKFLRRLLQNGQLPGWSKSDDFPERDIHYHFQYPDLVTFDDFVKNWDLSRYHYQVRRASKKGPWKLVRAWRTEPTGHVVEEYTVP